MQSAAGPTPPVCWELSPSVTACVSIPPITLTALCSWQGTESQGESCPFSLTLELLGDHRVFPAVTRGGAGASLGMELWVQPFPSHPGPHCRFSTPGSAAGFGVPGSRSRGSQDMQASRRSRHPGNSGGGWHPAGSPVLSERMAN